MGLVRLLFAAVVLLGGGAEARAADTVKLERELGRKFALEAAARLPIVRDPDLVTYVRRTGAKIVESLGPQPFRYRFFVVRDGRVNAFAVPGGYVYVHTGLLLEAANDDEVAGVLAHEVAHVHAHHLLRQQEKTRLVNYATLLALLGSFLDPAIGAAAIGAQAAAQLKYSREFEQEADYLGARYMQSAGFDARGLLDFFHKLWERQRTTPTFLPPFLLTHPLSEERLNNLEAVLRTRQWESAARRPPSRELRWAKFWARIRTSSPQEAAADYARAHEAEPGDPVSASILGAALVESGDLERARAVLEPLAPRDARARRELGRALFRLRETDRAAELLRSVTAEEPDDALAWFELGRVLVSSRRWDAALEAFRNALRVLPDFEEAHRELGLAAGRAGREGEGFFHLAEAARCGGDYGTAIGHYRRAIERLDDPAAKERAEKRLRELQEFVESRR